MKFFHAFCVSSSLITSIAVRTHEDDLHLENASASVRMQEGLAVFGHTALSTLKVYGVTADEGGKCRGALKKIKDLATEEEERKPKPGQHTDKEVDKAMLADLASHAKGEKVLDDADEVLDQADLNDAMVTGEVWTAHDQNALVECELGAEGGIGRLEEHNHTSSGDDIFQGDMAFAHGDSSLLELKEHLKSGQKWAGQTWPDGVLKFCFAQDTDPQAQHAFRAAMQMTNSQVPCIRFQQLQTDRSGQNCESTPSVVVQSRENGCYSYVGITNVGWGKSQPLNLGRGCHQASTAAHEMGHSLGLAHEQSRPDRDRYIHIHWENIMPDQFHNFNKENGAWMDEIYDPLSLMHYDSMGFSKNRLPAITGRNPAVTRVIGQRQSWSQYDIIQLGKMYNCESHVRPQVNDAQILRNLVPDFKREEKPSGFWHSIKKTFR